MSINIQFEFSCPGRYGARHMLDCDVTPLDHHRKPYKICYESQGNQLCFGTRGLRTPFATVTLDRPPQVHIRGTKLQRAPFSGAASEFLTYMDRPEGRITRMKYGDTICFWKNQHRNGQVLTEFEDPRIGEPYASWSRSENGTVDLHYYQRGLALGIIYPIIVSVIIEIYGLNLGDGHHCSSKWMWDQWFLWYKDTGCLPDPNLSHHFGTPLRDQISTHLKNLLHHRQENLFHSLHNPYQYKFNFRNHGKTSHVLDCDLKSTSADGRTNMPDFTIRCTPEVPDHLDFYMRRKEAPYGHFASLGLQTIQDAKLTIWSEEKRVFEWLYYNDYKKCWSFIYKSKIYEWKPAINSFYELRETLSSPNSPPLVSWAGGEDLYIEPSIFWDDTLELCVVFVAILFYGLNLGSIPNYSNKRMWSQYDKWCLNHPQHQGAEAPVRFKRLFGVRLQGQ